MAWLVSRVEADDFMSYPHLDLDLSKLPRMTLVLGDRGTGRSNGAGKSTILEVITWVLYGETCRKLSSVDKVIRRGCKKCVGRVTVLLDDGRQMSVERSRGPGGPSLRVGLPGASTTAGMQAVIDATLGDRQAFMSTAMFSGATSSFCRLPDSTRKEVLERMAGCDGYSGAWDLSKTRLDEAGARALTVNALAAQQQGVLDGAVARRQQSASLALSHRSALIDVYIDAMEKAMDLHDVARDRSSAVSAWLAKASSERSKADEEKRRYEAESDRLEAEIVILDGQVAKIQLSARDLRTKIRAEEDDIANIQAGRHADNCPKCGQRWPQEGDPVVIAKQIKVHRDAILETQTRLAPLVEELPALQSRRDSLQTARQEAVRFARTANAAFDEREYRTLLQAAIQAENDLRDAQDEVQAAGDAIPEDPCSPEELAPLDLAVEVAREGLKALQAEYADLMVQLRRLQFWRKGFSRAGLPSFLVDSTVPDMNEVVHEVAQALTDGELTVRFNPAAAKGTQSILAVEVDYAKGGEGFDSSSHGEQTRVDVAVLFALRDLAARRLHNPCSQLFLDEVMDGTDDHFVQAFMSLLRSRYKGLQVLMVSHDAGVASLCDTTLVARKVEDVSVLLFPD